MSRSEPAYVENGGFPGLSTCDAPPMTDALSFIHDLSWDDLSGEVRTRSLLCLLDLVGVAVGGAITPLSGIIRAHAARHFGGPVPIPFEGNTASAPGVALALGMTIDALDGHDGYNPGKGHVGCGLFPATFAVAAETGALDGRAFLTTLTMGYEIGSRLGVALHASVSDYHTSGAWIAVAAAASGARIMALDPARTREALGIAEYHGPRSQMMRCIDHPTMLKDGSGWGAMAGVSAAYLAADGFTGAPAITLEDAADHYTDLGSNWLILEQYFKPYPVCRWAQAPIEAAMTLKRTHGFAASNIARIEIETFHNATRLAVSRPRTTEEAQYSTSFPVAIALARGDVGAADVAEKALTDPEILRLSDATEMREHDHANASFPASRPARTIIHLANGQSFTSDWHEPRWDHRAPATETELRKKFRRLTRPVIGVPRADALEAAVNGIETDGLAPLLALMAQPINSRTKRGSAA